MKLPIPKSTTHQSAAATGIGLLVLLQSQIAESDGWGAFLENLPKDVGMVQIVAIGLLGVGLGIRKAIGRAETTIEAGRQANAERLRTQAATLDALRDAVGALGKTVVAMVATDAVRDKKLDQLAGQLDAIDAHMGQADSLRIGQLDDLIGQHTALIDRGNPNHGYLNARLVAIEELFEQRTADAGPEA